MIEINDSNFLFFLYVTLWKWGDASLKLITSSLSTRCPFSHISISDKDISSYKIPFKSRYIQAYSSSINNDLIVQTDIFRFLKCVIMFDKLLTVSKYIEDLRSKTRYILSSAQWASLSFAMNGCRISFKLVLNSTKLVNWLSVFKLYCFMR